MPNLNNTKKNKHLTTEERAEIQEALNRRMSFKAIARLLMKDPTTISYEVKHHRMEHKGGFSTSSEPCPLLLKAPFVCNGCSKRSNTACRHTRYIYNAVKAQKEYKIKLSDSREGISLNKKEFYTQDMIITKGLSSGQHLYHIMANNPEITSSKSTVYRNFHKGYYSASILTLPRAVKFKRRNSSPSSYVPPIVKKGRTYQDFLCFTEDNPGIPITELDTVIGSIGGKVIMTLLFVDFDFMFGLLLDNKSSAEASAKIISLKQRLNKKGLSFAELMPVLLTDNGGEFSNVFSFENNLDGQKESQLFFCDPMHSSQKPHIEKNHTLFRDIVPKGESFNAFTQDTVNLIFSHVNSISRKQFHGKSAYDMFAYAFSQELAEVLGIRKIPADKVIQSPLLLRKK